MKSNVLNRFFLGALALTGVLAVAGNCMAAEKRCVVVWSEGTAPKNIYPKDINSAVAEGLADLKDWEVVVANLGDADQGLPDSLLNRADVLIWWGHKKHGDVKDALADKIVKRVTDGQMGFIGLHSAHFSKPNIKLMSVESTKQELLDAVQPKGRVAAWGAYKGDSATLKVMTKDAAHPIAQGLPAEFTIDQGERYNDPYAVPSPASIVFSGEYTLKDGGKSPATLGLCWNVGKGRMFYFQAGHETNPTYFDANVRKMICNAVLWTAPDKK